MKALPTPTEEAALSDRREWQFRRKDGSVFPAEVIATLMPDGNLLGLIRESSERRQTELALRASEEHFRFLNHLVEATRALADPQLQTIPVVVLTSSRETPDLIEFYKHGVNAYVVKPVDFSQFMKAVSQLGIFWAAINEPPPPSPGDNTPPLARVAPEPAGPLSPSTG